MEAEGSSASRLGAWVHSRSDTTRVALRDLDGLPESATGHGRAVPFPFIDRETVRHGFTNSEINRAIESAPCVTTPIRGLYAIQHSVRESRVAEYIQYPQLVEPGATNPRTGVPVDRPIVLQRDGRRVIWDGHHRAVAAKLRGERSVCCRLVDLDKLDK